MKLRPLIEGWCRTCLQTWTVLYTAGPGRMFPCVPAMVVIVHLVSACSTTGGLLPETGASLIDEQKFIRHHGGGRKPAQHDADGDKRVRHVGILHTPSQTEPPPGPAVPAVSLQLSGVPASVFVQMMSEATGYNVVVAPDAAKTVLNLNLDTVNWRDALAVVAELHGLTLYEQERGRLIRLHKRNGKGRAGAGTTMLRPSTHTTTDGGVQMELFSLRYTRPGDVAELIKSLFDGPGGGKPVIAVDERTYSLIVKGSRQDLALTAALIEQVDVRTRQVLIEAFIVEAGDDFERSLGLRLGRERDGGFTVNNIRGPFINLPVTGATGGLGLVFGKSRIRVELTALENEGKSRIISNPRIFTLDNQPAVIFQGDEVPYQTVSDKGTQTEFKQAGLRLAVTPSIVGDSHLVLDISINKDTVDTRLQNPPITRRELSSRLMIADGDMVVIGGIHLDTNVSASDRVPFASYLPVVGGLFRHHQRKRDVKQLLVFISSEIVP